MLFFVMQFFSSKIKKKKISSDTEVNWEKKINENIKTETTQPNLPFKNVEKNFNTKTFKLPPIEYLKKLSKNDLKLENSDNKHTNPEFLEKIFLDFGVKGKIKKISHGPVVTLYEFEPAPGIRVSKIINLSDDVARNTSSLSTRVATIPGKKHSRN